MIILKIILFVILGILGGVLLLSWYIWTNAEKDFTDED
jgi:hypothetical protein